MLRRSTFQFQVVQDPLMLRHSMNTLRELRSRQDLKHAQRIIIKAGTSTTTESDGYPCLRRVTSIIEQIATLRRMNKEVVFVASGAVGYGRCVQRRQRILMTSAMERMYDVDNQIHATGSQKNTLAAIGQSAMMNLYSALFQQLDTPVGQLLVTPNDFMLDDRRKNLITTLAGFMELGVVPVVNENDAVTYDMKKPSKGNPNYFADNDGLACLVGKHIGADLIIFLTDVDGLYDRNPNDPQANFIPTYIPQNIEFSEKSSMGRGGMESKVAAATNALDVGIPAACIVSGHRHKTILNVLDGSLEGTLFVPKPELLKEDSSVQFKNMQSVVEGRQPKKAVANPTDKKEEEVKPDTDNEVAKAIKAQAQKCREGGRALLTLTSSQRSHILNCVADALSEKSEAILSANKEDVDRETKAGTLAKPLLSRLKLDEAKMKVLIEGVRSLAASKEPVGKVLSKMEMADGAILRQETTPIGVINVIFESRPDSLVQIAALALRSCNGLLLKGGKEAVRSNAALHRVIVDAVHQASNGVVPRGVIGLIESRSEISELLKLDKDIDLVIPRGSNALVRSIQHGTRIPVMGHADGICHTYIDATCKDLDKAADIVIDAKTQYPSACNATETLLIDASIHPAETGRVLKKLAEAGIQLLGGPVAMAVFPGQITEKAADFQTEYGDNRMAVELVQDVNAAVQHINKYGSHHTDAILSDDEEKCKTFLNAVDSACVFKNASTRMADGYRFGLGAEVGISTGRIHARGPVGVDGLLSQKWVLEVGSVVDGITAAAFSSGDKEFSHKHLPLQ